MTGSASCASTCPCRSSPTRAVTALKTYPAWPGGPAGGVPGRRPSGRRDARIRMLLHKNPCVGILPEVRRVGDLQNPNHHPALESVGTLEAALTAEAYVPDPALSMALYLALRMGKP